MSIEDYKQAGFLTSVQIQQAIVDKAEADAMQAYILPIAPDADTTEVGAAREALMSLADLLVKQRTIFATRSGAKEKTTPQSQSADDWRILRQCAATCALKLSTLAQSAGVGDWENKVTDICGILYKTNFIGL